MRCPLCPGSNLEPKYVRGIEVDVCPTCRGIWLDRGEIDRLGDDSFAPPPPMSSGAERRDRGGDRREYRGGDRRDDGGDRPKQKKRKSTAKRLADLLEDILD